MGGSSIPLSSLAPCGRMPLMKTPREGSGASSFPCMPFTPDGVGGVAILPILRTWWGGWPIWGGAWGQRYRSSRPSWTGPAGGGRGWAGFGGLVAGHPEVEDYARFRATGERQRAPWPSWSRPLCDGVLTEGDYDERARRYHLYVQWVAREQIRVLSEHSRRAGVNLYLDLPLGVHPHSYDVWREREAFVLGVSGGAPPDVVFTQGQDWGFPPLHPEAIREQGYRYVIAYLRHQLQHTTLLRIDHVMGLHRLFWIPKGLEARDGVCVRYPAEELYAIFCLESHRHRASIVGENLGTVPAYVNSAMARHNLHRMYVLQYELDPGPNKGG